MRLLNRSTSGFTLIETLLVVAVLSILTGLSVPLFQQTQVQNDLDTSVLTLTQSLRRAQLLSQAVEGDATWGVSVQSGGITLFKGASYAARDPLLDESFSLAASLTPSGLSEVVYSKLDGLPLATGTVTLTSTANQTKSVTINAKGTLSY